MTFAERGGGVAQHALFAFGGSPGSVEEGVGYAGEGGDNDDGPRSCSFAIETAWATASASARTRRRTYEQLRTTRKSGIGIRNRTGVILSRQAKDRGRPGRGLSVGMSAIPRCARNDGFLL
jgi:hypothetical protein